MILFTCPRMSDVRQHCKHFYTHRHKMEAATNMLQVTCEIYTIVVLPNRKSPNLYLYKSITIMRLSMESGGSLSAQISIHERFNNAMAWVLERRHAIAQVVYCIYTALRGVNSSSQNHWLEADFTPPNNANSFPRITVVHNSVYAYACWKMVI